LELLPCRHEDFDYGTPVMNTAHLTADAIRTCYFDALCETGVRRRAIAGKHSQRVRERLRQRAGHAPV
jgi:hypothetical protein